jgi:catechol 2,3-dioxygenase-like lactoylglutathione lyase family enzyme
VSAAISSLVRAAILVGDLERSSAFYRALGLTEVYYEGELDKASVARVLAVPQGTTTRCRILKRPGTPNYGMIGLFELKDPPLTDLPAAPSLTPRRGEAVLVFYVADMDAALAAAAHAGATMVAEATTFSMPHGTSAEVTLRDPDGVLLNLIGRGPDEQFESESALAVAARLRPKG